MLTKILRFIEDQLEESRRFKLELKKCPNCENLAELLKLKQFECDRLVDKINEVPKTETITYSDNQTSLDHEPISFKSTRTRLAQQSHNSFKRVQKLKEEFEAERRNAELNKNPETDFEELVIEN